MFALCEAKKVELVILNQGEETTFEEDLAKDVLDLITVFSAPPPQALTALPV